MLLLCALISRLMLAGDDGRGGAGGAARFALCCGSHFVSGALGYATEHLSQPLS